MIRRYAENKDYNSTGIFLQNYAPLKIQKMEKLVFQ